MKNIIHGPKNKLPLGSDSLRILSHEEILAFQEIIWNYFNLHGRTFLWRETTDPYHIFVSEVMLQQTQTHRVIEKYRLFIDQFPTVQSLAQASLREVLFFWQGLGYNRRALALQKSAQIILEHYNGSIPNNPDKLIELPGIGKATAASICAFAFNQPTIFIETNLRTVYIHQFFSDKPLVHDQELFPLIEQTLEKTKARLWYYALMDYGVMLKKKLPNPSRKSVHHIKQSTFIGSDRQIRGAILRELTAYSVLSQEELFIALNEDKIRVEKVLNALIKEGFIKKTDNSFMLM